METPVKIGTKVLVDRHALPVSKYQIYSSTHSTSMTVEAVISSSTDWEDGEYRYGIKIGDVKTVFPIRRRDFEIIESPKVNK